MFSKVKELWCLCLWSFTQSFLMSQEDIFKVKPSVFYNQPQDLQSDLFNSEDPFKTDPFKGDPFESDPFGKAPSTSTDPFEGDPFKEADPFKASSEDFFKKTTKMDHFSTTDPLCKSATLPSKQTSHFAGSDPFSTNHQKPRGSDLFSTLDPFGSSTFNSATNSCTGFADFSHMSKARDPFEGRANWLPDYQKVKWGVRRHASREAVINIHQLSLS
ncbi:PREDICTED: epidermal growth factor receptor substrate 15-like 1 isoform X1 [Poecilia mexicana]|uniref:epidermal growth factor receptor substrate 15-like 1 isoform X1 n=2 Tax=Poecilia mexicana TaxID=48701 RepID=UPI00072DAECD|nr:PREDICTED: epidermal growth factor receptor substrate 15-like 1 isoform X1 [Poecilia mexicana]